jgi:PHYB activation tagged suppressor 1
MKLLRLYPLALGISRKVEREIQLGKFTLPANINVCINVMALRHAPQIWGEDVHFSSQRSSQKGWLKLHRTTLLHFFHLDQGP